MGDLKKDEETPLTEERRELRLGFIF